MKHLVPCLFVAACQAAPTDVDGVDTSAADTSAGHQGGVADLPTAPYDPSVDTYPWGLPDWAPRPPVPASNPMTVDKVALGRRLFYDDRLSGNGTQSCATCHEQASGFTDGRAVAVGSTGDHTPRNSMALVNVAYMTSLNWANPGTLSLESQVLVPMFGETPIELGLTGNEEEVIARLKAEPIYQEAFPSVFAEADDPWTLQNAALALAAFVRSMVSFDSPVDRFTYGDDPDVLSAEALRGLDLFFSERLDCHHCHGSWNYSLTTAYAGQTFPQIGFQNNGLYNLDGTGSYPPGNTGLHEFTGAYEDMGRFRPPTLRNVAVTPPYMHDGSLDSLDAVLDMYAAGGMLTEDGPKAGDGRESPLKSGFVHGFTLSSEDRTAVRAFLEALTDETFLSDPRFSDPWR